MLTKLCPLFTLIWSLSLESTSKRINTGSVSPGNKNKGVKLVSMNLKHQYERPYDKDDDYYDGLQTDEPMI